MAVNREIGSQRFKSLGLFNNNNTVIIAVYCCLIITVENKAVLDIINVDKIRD